MSTDEPVFGRIFSQLDQAFARADPVARPGAAAKAPTPPQARVDPSREQRSVVDSTTDPAGD